MARDPTSDRREAERRARATERSARGMVFETIRALDEDVTLHDESSPEERLVAMARLCRRAWLASGREMPSVPRAELPGEVFRIDHGAPRRSP